MADADTPKAESGSSKCDVPKKKAPKKAAKSKAAKGAKTDTPKDVAKPEDAKPDTPKDVAKPEDAKPDTPTDVAKLEDAKPEESTDVAKIEEDDEPEPRTYTPEEIEEIAKRVETYADNTPPYKPTHILSPEFEGTSGYERGIEEFKAQVAESADRLSRDPDAAPEEVAAAKRSVLILDRLYENYNQGMNVFRTAKGGRSKLRV